MTQSLPMTPDTVIATWNGPFDASTPFGVLSVGEECEIPVAQAESDHWLVNGQPLAPQEPAAEDTFVQDPAPADIADTEPAADAHDFGEEPL